MAGWRWPRWRRARIGCGSGPRTLAFFKDTRCCWPGSWRTWIASQARAVLGLGAGNLESEFQALGIAHPPLRQRQAALAEALQIVPPLLRGETVGYAGLHFKVDGVRLQPVPVQQPYVPVLVAGVGERFTLRAVAQYADCSNFISSIVDRAADVERKYAVLRGHCDAIGRPSGSVLRTYQFVPVLLADSAAELAAKRELVPQFLRAMDPQTSGGLVGTPDRPSSACSRTCT
jgi:alkanesulfonate monooxygenase SsuD/methylene tetrahydromethanopterin reductase-like flavin-dependent oxidoreductase (luciferase family)